jgi:ubiquitin C-terminal hydrolase
MGGWVQSEVKCPKCPYRSNTFTMELSSALEIPPGVDSVTKALLKYTSSEVLCTGNEWKCDGYILIISAIISKLSVMIRLWYHLKLTHVSFNHLDAIQKLMLASE